MTQKATPKDFFQIYDAYWELIKKYSQIRTEIYRHFTIPNGKKKRNVVAWNDKVKVYDFSKEKGFYKYLLLEERQFCNENAATIIRKANHIYTTVFQGKDLMMQKNCCDFKKLELAYQQYVQQATEAKAHLTATAKEMCAQAVIQLNDVELDI